MPTPNLNLTLNVTPNLNQTLINRRKQKRGSRKKLNKNCKEALTLEPKQLQTSHSSLTKRLSAKLHPYAVTISIQSAFFT